MQFRARLLAMIFKETLQLRRDRLTFAMMFGIPVMQLLLFGFAINNDPKGLPAAVLFADRSEITRSIVAAIGNTDYFSFVREAATEAEANGLLQRGEVQFVVTIPSDLTRRLVRGEKARIAIEADATDTATNRDHRQRAFRRQSSGRPGARARSHWTARIAQGKGRSDRSRLAPALQPRGHHQPQHRVGTPRRRPHHDDGHDDRARRDASASASAAPWSICSPCRCGPSRS